MIGFKPTRVRINRPFEDHLDFKPREYEPESYQAEFHESRAMYNLMIGAPGTGKTITGTQEFKRFIDYGTGNALLIAPTFQMFFDIMMKEIRVWVDPKTRMGLPRSAHGAKAFPIGRDRYAFIRSAEAPEAIDGLNDVAFVWIDEGDVIHDELVWDFVLQRLKRQTSFGPSIPRRVCITCTPRLRQGKSWVKERLFDRAEEGDARYFARRVKFWECSRISESDKQEIREDHPTGSWARAQYEAEWANIVEGAVYDVPAPIPDPCRLWDCTRVICGVDCGYSEDPFVWLVIGLTPVGTWHVFGEIRSVPREHESGIAARIANFFQAHAVIDKLGLRGGSPAVSVYHDHDPFQMDQVANELYAKHGLNFSYNRARKRSAEGSAVLERVGLVRDMFHTGKISIGENCRTLYEEISNYAYIRRGVAAEGFTHEYSHGSDALGYALYTEYHSKKTRFYA